MPPKSKPLNASVRAAKKLGYMQPGNFKLLPKKGTEEYKLYKQELDKIVNKKKTCAADKPPRE